MQICEPAISKKKTLIILVIKLGNMELKVSISTIFNCLLERAFKTPMLCDVSKIHTGYGLMPRITHCTEDKQWWQVGSTKLVFAAKSPTFAEGETSIDKVLERIENKYWKIEVSEFKSWMLGFDRFTGEWATKEMGENQIQIDYTYTLHARGYFWYPLNWLFVYVFWKQYMKSVIENVRKLAYNQEPYLYP